MAELVAAAIKFSLQNFFLTLFTVGLLFSAVALARAPRPLTHAVVLEKITAWYVFFGIGVGNLYNFVLHGFFGEMTASFIGWADSPFQFEVATASLGFAVVGFMTAFRSFDLRLAAIVGPGVFALGAAVGHVREMITAHDFAPGNAGLVFWADIAFPLFGFTLLWLQYRQKARS